MGKIRDHFPELARTFKGMAAGDPGAFYGVPGDTGTGDGNIKGTGDGSLTKEQEQKLMRFFHQQYGRYPQTEFEFQNWLRDNW
jgi:hypothetical protein